MKHFNKHFLSVVFLLIFHIAGHAQLNQQSVNRDSTMARGMKQMQKTLSLTDEQVSSLIKLTRAYEEKMKGDAFEKKQGEVRKKQLVDHYDQYRKGIKKILTSKQWEQYQLIESQRREILQKQARDKKIKIVPGEIRN